MQHARIITRELHWQCRIKPCEGFHLGRGNPGTARELSPNTTRRTGPSATAYTCFTESSVYSFRFFDLMHIFIFSDQFQKACLQFSFNIKQILFWFVVTGPLKVRGPWAMAQPAYWEIRHCAESNTAAETTLCYTDRWWTFLSRSRRFF